MPARAENGPVGRRIGVAANWWQMTIYDKYFLYLCEGDATTGRKALSDRVASNYLSRVKRIERLIGKQLPNAIERHGLERIEREIRTCWPSNVSRYSLYDCISAARSFENFLVSTE